MGISYEKSEKVGGEGEIYMMGRKKGVVVAKACTYIRSIFGETNKLGHVIVILKLVLVGLVIFSAGPVALQTQRPYH